MKAKAFFIGFVIGWFFPAIIDFLIRIVKSIFGA